MTPSDDKPDYGIDAPKVVRNFIVLGTVFILFGVLRPLFPLYLPEPVAKILLGLAPSIESIGCGFIFTACLMLWGSKAGKFRLRDSVLDAMRWRGDERVLDVGCGHGLMMIGAAKRLRTGKAIGIDLWSQDDQSRNSADATLRNAQIEGVSHRVEIKTGDARKLPFENTSFDVVLSSWALHNIKKREERDQALAEIVRVLKPGGRVAIIDIRHAREYARFFHQQGLELVSISAPSFLFFIPTHTIVACKPA